MLLLTHCHNSDKILFSDFLKMSQSYKSFVRVLEKWPVDKSKKGRDLGEAIRRFIVKSYPQGGGSVVEEAGLSRQAAALKRLVDNQHKENNPRVGTATFTGVSQENLQKITDVDFMEKMREAEEQRAFLGKLRNTFGRKS